jgi:cytochrome P450
MPKQLLRDEVMTLLLAGHDTTANALTWTFALLAQHPAVVSQLKHEVTRITHVPFEMEELPYTQNVIKESMRLFPPVYLFGREATRSIQLGDYTIRKGDSVVMSQWVVHRDKRFYSEPTNFDPEGWSHDFEGSLPKYAYFPFGGGPRVCLGKDVAMVEATAVLATLAAEFNVSLESPGDLRPWPTITLRPHGAVWAHIAKHRGSQTVQTSNEELSGGSLTDKAV